MKSFILCGGRGTRLDQEGKIRPKAMVKIGTEPIIMHIINNLIDYKINDFVLCLGYKKKIIENFFLKKFKNYITEIIKKKNHKILKIKKDNKKNTIYLVDTGKNSGTGGRLKIANKIIKNKDDFLMTYCDGLSNLNIFKLIQQHKKKKKLVTLTAVHPRHRYGIVKINNNLVKSFNNNNPKQNVRINGGFFIIKVRALELIKNKNVFWEQEPINKLIKKNQLSAYIHNGFWASLDTQKDKEYFNNLWKKKLIYWKKNKKN